MSEWMQPLKERILLTRGVGVSGAAVAPFPLTSALLLRGKPCIDYGH